MEQPRLAAWTPEAIRRFWNFTSQKKGTETEYFSYQVGGALIRLLQRAHVLTGDEKVLDFGCGPGYLLQKFLKTGSTCSGFDFSDESIRKVNERFEGLPNWAGAASSTTLPTPFDNEEFDVVTCTETLEHLLDNMIPTTLCEISRLLKNGGFALFTTPNDENLQAASIYCPFCDHVFHPVQHVRAFDERGLRQLLEDHGFKVLYCRDVDLFELEPPDRIDRSAVRRVVRAWLNRLLDVITPVKAAGTDYRQPRVGRGPNLIAIVQKRSR